MQTPVGLMRIRLWCRIAKAKLAWRSDPQEYRERAIHIRNLAGTFQGDPNRYPKLIRACYHDEALRHLDCLRRAYEATADNTPDSELAWLTLISILRRVSTVGTAPWQYVLPKKTARGCDPLRAFDEASQIVYDDMRLEARRGAPATFHRGDARTCDGVPDAWANLVITSPPYPNNYDYADATRLEMTFMGEVHGWGDLHEAVRKHLVCSCTQHVPEKAVDLEKVLATPELQPIHTDLRDVCTKLAAIRKTRGGRKTYHLMVACYFRDLAHTWKALRRVCASPSQVCFVIGDSAPYGVYVPVIPWLGALALAAGFSAYRFEKTRDRNVKWKNRKHRVPLQEGHLWVQG